MSAYITRASDALFTAEGNALEAEIEQTSLLAEWRERVASPEPRAI